MLNTRFRTSISCLVVVLSTAICALAHSAGMSRNLSSTSKSGSHALAPLSQSNSITRRAVESYSKLPMTFEANRGQTDSRVKFLAQGPGYTLFLTSSEAVLTLQGPTHVGNPSANSENSSAVVMRLVGANPVGSSAGLEQLQGKSNYFIGDDPVKWHTNIPNYAKVRYQDVYAGVDLVYYGNPGRLEYDFLVSPGSDPRSIRLAFERVVREPGKVSANAASLRIDVSGDLVVALDGSEVRLHKPTAYQLAADYGSRTADATARHLIAANYVLGPDGQVAIRLGQYDKARAVVIDPVLTYSSRLGGTNSDIGSAIAVDAGGNVYVMGTTSSFDFPVVNQISGACNAGCVSSFTVAFITKINALGNAIVYSSRVGGSTFDEGFGVSVDSAGNAYLAGLTQSADFPRLNQIAGACAGTCGTGTGQYDAFVTKINPAGNALVYSSLIGGSNNDFASAIAVDGSGNAYLTGTSNSTDFPQINPIPGACVGTCGTGSFPTDAFAVEVNAAGNALVYSSNLAGSAFTQGRGIAVDGMGNAYVTGLTQSADFPRVNQIVAACPGTCGTGANTDGFVTKINARGISLGYSSVFGGSGSDTGSAIAVNNSGNAYLTGSTGSADFPQVNPINRACTHGCGVGGGDAFVTKINSAGTAIVYSSPVGGEGDDEGEGIAVDSLGNAYLTGFTHSTNFPSVHPIRSACVGTCSKKLAANVFAVEVNAAGAALVYSTVIGGSDTDEGFAITVDASGNAYLTGSTGSLDFPTVNQIPGACLGSCGTTSNQDAFVLKIAP